jgi:hypothetical protein
LFCCRCSSLLASRSLSLFLFLYLLATLLLASIAINYERRPCHSSRGYSPTSYRGGPGLIPGQVMWDLWWIERHWDRFSASTSVCPALQSSGSGTIGQIVTVVPTGLPTKLQKMTASISRNDRLQMKQCLSFQVRGLLSCKITHTKEYCCRRMLVSAPLPISCNCCV